MKLTILGTGNAKVTKCYNTCFVLNKDKEYFMIDGGGGNTILKQLEDAGISWKEISTIFVTHKHIDHLLGIIWMLRMYCQGMAIHTKHPDDSKQMDASYVLSGNGKRTV